MKKFKIALYNIIIFLIFFPIFDIIASNFFLKIDDRTCYVLEKHYYELKKNCSGRQQFKSSFPIINVKTDKYGLRTNKTRDKENKKEKILFFGDSMTFGVGIDYEKTFVGLLEDKFTNYDFYNFGVGSYSPSVHLYKLERAIKNKLLPKKIILMLDLSDIYDEGKRWVDTNDNSKPLLTYDTSKNWKPDKKFTHKNFQISRLIASKLNYNTRIIKNKIKNLDNSNNEKEQVKKSFQGEFTYKNLENLNKRFWSDKIFFTGVKKIKEKVEQISHISKNYKSEFYIVVYPWGETLVHGQKAFSWENFGNELCSNNRCILVNTFPAFESKKNIDRFWYSNLYFIGDEHLNPKGNLFLSKILEREVFKD